MKAATVEEAAALPLGDWFLTQSGKQFWPLAPRVQDLDIYDIAHALAHICRYGGHCNPFYSVAQHSVHVSYLVPKEWSREGLMHDATEAYCGDMVRPLKIQMPAYREVEANIWKVIATRYNLALELPKEVKQADDVALMTERRDVMPKSLIPWSVRAEPDPGIIRPLSPEEARYLFLRRYKQLFPKEGGL